MSKKSLESQQIERRESNRTEIETDVKIICGDTETVEQSKNYSLTGLFIKSNSPEDVKINDEVEVSFVDEKGESHIHKGQVVRTSKTGFAIHYWRTSPPSPIE